MQYLQQEDKESKTKTNGENWKDLDSKEISPTPCYMCTWCNVSKNLYAFHHRIQFPLPLQTLVKKS